MSLSTKQVEAVLDHPDARIVILEGAVRSGKTVSTLLRFLRNLADAPSSGHVLIIGKTLQAIERNIINPMQDRALMGELATHTVHTRGASTARILGRDVELVGANDARSEEKIRGLTACLAMVDEATLVPEAFWQQLGARLSVPGAKLIATTNPGGPRHWLKTKYLDRADELDLASWHFTLDDNPSLDPAYVEALKAENTGIFYARNIEGRWVAAEGAIFDAWDERKHVMPWAQLPTIVRLVAGVDYGTTNPTDAVILGCGTDGRWYALDEWRTPRVGLDDATQVAALAAWIARPHAPQPVQPPLSALHVDPAAASFKVALRAAALPIRDADNDVLTGIGAMTSALHSGRLRITDRCIHLLGEIPNYSWDAKATEKGADKPVKVDDHCLAAGTLVVTEQGEVPIERVRPGQMVWTRRGWRAVQDAWQVTESAPVFTLTTSDGRKITGTGNHRVWVAGRGWIRMDALRYGDRLKTCRLTGLRRSSSRGPNTGATPTLRASVSGGTSRRASPTSSGESGAFTRKSGWTPMASRTSRAATTSTTSTTTTATTTRLTWPASLDGITSRITAAWSRRPSSTTSTASAPSRPSGTDPTKAESGTASTGNGPGSAASPSPRRASSAARASTRSTAARLDSARTLVSRRGGVRLALTTLTGRASNAVQRSGPTGTPRRSAVVVHVEHVRPAGNAAVYDLTVEGAHEFFANGILVHNSIDACRYAWMAVSRNDSRQHHIG